MAALALGLVSAAIQARVLGPVGRGELALAMVPGTLLAMLLCFGLPDYFARRAAQGTDPSELSKLAALLSIGIALVFAAPYAVLAEFQSPVGSDAWWILLLYAIGVPIFVYGYSLTGILLGAGSWKLVAALRVAPLVLIVVGLTVIALFVNAPTPLTVGILLVTVSALGPLGSLVKPELRPRGSISWTMAREALGFGLRGWFAGAVALLNQRIDLLLVTFIASAGGIGLYAVSTSLAAVLAGIANAIAMPARNKVTRGERHGVATAVSLTMLIAVTVATAVTLCLPMLIHVVLGDQFLAAAPVMTVLLFAQVPLAGVIVLTQCLIGVGRPGSPFAGELLAFFTTIILTLLYFPTFGILAAALATGVGNLISLFVLLALAQKHIFGQPLWRYFFIPPTRLISIVRGR